MYDYIWKCTPINRKICDWYYVLENVEFLVSYSRRQKIYILISMYSNNKNFIISYYNAMIIYFNCFATVFIFFSFPQTIIPHRTSILVCNSADNGDQHLRHHFVFLIQHRTSILVCNSADYGDQHLVIIVAITTILVS